MKTQQPGEKKPNEIRNTDPEMVKLQKAIDSKLNQQSQFTAGSLAQNYNNWTVLTSDKLMLATVRGFRLQFDTLPVQHAWPSQLIKEKSEINIANKLLQELITKKVIEPTKPSSSGFMSNIFLRPKKTGGHRMILNLKPLNPHVQYQHFKMATLSSALELVTPNCYMASLDLSDAYYSISVAKDHRKYLQFIFEGQVYHFTCLANGVSSAPRTFTKLLKIPLSHLRQKHNMLITAYLDDLLIIANDPKRLLQHIDLTQSMLISLGFTISIKKSSITPSQVIQFLGFIIDSRSMTVSPSPDKPPDIKQLITTTLTKTSTTIRQFAQLLGKLAATLPGNKFGQVYLKRLETAKTVALKNCQFSYEGNIKLTKDTRHDLYWWLENIEHVSRPVTFPNPQLTIFTDASFQGWGCHVPDWDTRTGGRWSPSEQNYDINSLELMAVLFSLKACCHSLTKTHILIQSDNTTTVVSINRQGSTQSKNCNSIARQIWLWVMQTENWLSATHCPGVLNVDADLASREFNDTTEWGLNKRWFQKLCQHYQTPSIDLFASRLNHQVETYCAWQPDPGAIAIDAFTIDWSSFKTIYAFPPFSIVGKVLQKITFDKASGIVVIPDWPTQPWFARLHQMLMEPPLRIRTIPKTLTLHHAPDLVHPLTGKLTLLVCKVSDNSISNKDYRNE